jgi:hypothetical protein
MSELFTSYVTIQAASKMLLTALSQQLVDAGVFKIASGAFESNNVILHTHLNDDPEAYDTTPVDWENLHITVAYGAYWGLDKLLLKLIKQKDDYVINGYTYCAETPEIHVFSQGRSESLIGFQPILNAMTAPSKGVITYLQHGMEGVDKIDLDDGYVLDDVERQFNTASSTMYDKIMRKAT